jgi:3-hydroxyisobutyrate dehydrogenase-like beta-hydroxyacid dehydrogenase
LKGEAISSSIDSATEDIHLGLELAKEMGTPSELTSLVDAAFTQLCDAGLGKADQTEVVREFMRQADVDLFEN